ncbi:MAG: hypothetical protein WKG07_22910 [Hymenobacter sp.]
MTAEPTWPTAPRDGRREVRARTSTTLPSVGTGRCSAPSFSTTWSKPRCSTTTSCPDNNLFVAASRWGRFREGKPILRDLMRALSAARLVSRLHRNRVAAPAERQAA